MSAKAVIKSVDMSDELAQETVESAAQVILCYMGFSTVMHR